MCSPTPMRCARLAGSLVSVSANMLDSLFLFVSALTSAVGLHQAVQASHQPSVCRHLLRCGQNCRLGHHEARPRGQQGVLLCHLRLRQLPIHKWGRHCHPNALFPLILTHAYALLACSSLFSTSGCTATSDKQCFVRDRVDLMQLDIDLCRQFVASRTCMHGSGRVRCTTCTVMPLLPGVVGVS